MRKNGIALAVPFNPVSHQEANNGHDGGLVYCSLVPGSNLTMVYTLVCVDPTSAACLFMIKALTIQIE
jgi:hypothetical protein